MPEFNTEKLKRKLGLEKSGKAQGVLDATVVKYLRLTMPVDSGMMMTNTRVAVPGKVQVQVPYAHYQNEGILYVMENGKGAYYSPTYGYWSKPGVKKVPSSRKLNYRGGTDRGSHFVERTCKGHFKDILNEVKEGIK